MSKRDEDAGNENGEIIDAHNVNSTVVGVDDDDKSATGATAPVAAPEPVDFAEFAKSHKVEPGAEVKSGIEFAEFVAGGGGSPSAPEAAATDTPDETPRRRKGRDD